MSISDWIAIALAALHSEYPRLPDPQPAAVADLVTVLAERMAQAAPGTASQTVGAYSVMYAEGGTAVPLTATEAMLLRPYRRALHASVKVLDAIMEAVEETDDLRFCDLLDDNDQHWRRIPV
ncbi:MAG: hypothetical protein HY828_17625 [Actinobacteria bacterium]|nr:hypothetical protein [Actinomycetota bacterium]